MKAYLLIIRLYFRIVSTLAPKLAAIQAFRLFQRPLFQITRPLEQRFFQKARSFQIDHTPEPIQCYELGPKYGKIVILVHGWESNAGSMAAIATSLAHQGYRVVLFNLPAHGGSKLKQANLLTCREVMERVLRYYQYSGTPSIISHSFGSAVSTYTLATTNYAIDKFILLTTPDKIIDIFADFKNVISLGNLAFQKMLIQVQNLLGDDLKNIAIHHLTDRVRYEKLSIIHDEYDKVLPYSNSLNVYKKSKKATLTTLEKVGHYRMLWNDAVINIIKAELRAESLLTQ